MFKYCNSFKLKINEEEIRKYYQDIKIEYIPNKKITEKQFNENLSKILNYIFYDKIL